MDEMISRYADEVMRLIDADMDAELVPQEVSSFGELNDYLDASGYLTDAGVPWGTDDGGGYATVNAVCDEVSRRLAAECTCERNRSLRPDHAAGCERGGRP